MYWGLSTRAHYCVHGVVEIVLIGLIGRFWIPWTKMELGWKRSILLRLMTVAASEALTDLLPVAVVDGAVIQSL